MPSLNRRHFLLTLSAAAAAPSLLRAQSATSAAILTIHPKDVVAPVSTNYTGLSYESSQLVHPDFFSPANKALVAHVRTLGKQGVLRIGGNLSEFTVWSSTDLAIDPPSGVEGPDPGRGSTRTYTITPRSIRNLNGFLEATGWTLIYGLNLARGTVEAAVEEAEFVAKTCGPRLLALQFGNEPDLFRHGNDPHSTDPADRWTYEQFMTKWKAFYTAIRARLPKVPIAGPATSAKNEWLQRFTKDTEGDLVLFTTHYYAEGPPTDPNMNIDLLMHPNQKIVESVFSALELATQNHLPYRMSEGNSCYNAGKQGVSDTFAAALWVGDFMLSLAQRGGTGVNLHGGGNGLYTPIAGSPQSGFVARPIFYGMLLAEQFAGSSLVRTELTAAGTNLTAYAATRAGKTLVALFNKDDHAVEVAISGLPAAKTATAWRMTAPAITSTTGVTLAGATVGPDGAFKPSAIKRLSIAASGKTIAIPAASAVLLFV